MQDAQRPAARSAWPPWGSIRRGSPRSGIAIALIVKSRRAQVGLELGIRLDHRQRARVRIALRAGAGDVDLVAVELHLRRAEALVRDHVRPQPLGERRRVALDDEVDVGAAAPEQEVAHRAADQVDGLATQGAHPGELRVQLLQGPSESFGAILGCLHSG